VIVFLIAPLLCTWAALGYYWWNEAPQTCFNHDYLSYCIALAILINYLLLMVIVANLIYYAYIQRRHRRAQNFLDRLLHNARDAQDQQIRVLINEEDGSTGGLADWEVSQIMQKLRVIGDNSEEYLNKECQICSTELSEGDTILIIPGCRHVYHGKCITLWLRSKSHCPACLIDVRDALYEDALAQTRTQLYAFHAF
jgi:hypothetical protein